MSFSALLVRCPFTKSRLEKANDALRWFLVRLRKHPDTGVQRVQHLPRRSRRAAESWVSRRFWFVMTSSGVLRPKQFADGCFCAVLTGFFLLSMGLLCFIYLICALRTNIIFVGIFFGLFLEFVLLAASFWHLAKGHHDLGMSLQKVSTCHPTGNFRLLYSPSTANIPTPQASGAFGFLACVSGW